MCVSWRDLASREADRKCLKEEVVVVVVVVVV